ncbi:hypothetical protein GOODEAATRI_019311 [Goodea atripinnis]|uniref:Uncharacterized protein n=1 Tax=Goodea atripinnis TaxID=208336 RepID=A0ABV0NLJ8_9TELE
MSFASYYQLDNLVAIMDVNRLGQTLPKDMAEMVMKDLQSQIMNTSKHLYPPAPIEDSPPVSLRNIRMPSAPNYKPGEKVCQIYTNRV